MKILIFLLLKLTIIVTNKVISSISLFMSIEPINESNEKLSDTLNQENETLICKDGFCALPNIDNPKQLNNNNNIFDPL